ncbi:erbin [Periplaneta americana]|uniref:erbin n=1 Tax=Periplaneta americana TaxID=6978 RepID=UPI0037E8EBC1
MSWKLCFCCCNEPEIEDVKILDYRHLMLDDVPSLVFFYERTLEELYLDFNKIKDLPRPLFHCHGLRILSMSDNSIQTLPPAIASLINLQHLDLSKNELCGIPDNIKGCKHLVYVDVSVNQLEKLPEGFTQLLSLEELYLNNTCMEYLPANFGRLTKLRILELRENNLNTLPKSIARLVNLERLDIGQNEFFDMPEVIGRLVNLTELLIDCNRVRSIPKFIGNLKKMIHFDASSNNINWIAPEIGLCTRLIDLTVPSNEIQEIPETIGDLKELVTLKLYDNQLNSLPNMIGKLGNLEELIVSQNNLETLPPSVGLLRKLNMLNADDNMLEEIPPEIGSCTGLTILSLQSNKLQEVPAEIGHLQNLRMINLSGNLLRNLPVSILNLTGLTALWLSNNQSTPLTTLQKDVDRVTGQTVCVNFLLPQSSQEIYLKGSTTDKTDLESNPRHLYKAPERPHIRFSADAESDETGHLVRAPTPYPKELRAMAKHARSYQQHTRRASRESDSEAPLLEEMASPGPSALIKEAKVKKPNTVPLAAPSSNRRSDSEAPLLEEMASPGPSALIKEAKVTNPNTVPLPAPVRRRRSRGSEDDDTHQGADSSVVTNKQEIANVSIESGSHVIVPGTCVQVRSTAEEREKFFSQREENQTVAMSFPLETVTQANTPTTTTTTTVNVQRLSVALQQSGVDSPRLSMASEQQQQQPPPYHIAAAYSKQAAYFQIRGSCPGPAYTVQRPLSPSASVKEISSSTDRTTSADQKATDMKVPSTSLAATMEHFDSGVDKTSTFETDESSKLRQSPFKDSHSQDEGLVPEQVDNKEEIREKENTEDSKEFKNMPVNSDKPLQEENRKASVIETSIDPTPIDDVKVPENKDCSAQDWTSSEKSSTVGSVVMTPTMCISITPTTSIHTVTFPNTVYSTNVTTVNTNSTSVSTLVATSGGNIVGNKNIENGTRQEIPSPNIDNAKNEVMKIVPLSPKCRIPVRLGESPKSPLRDADDLLSKPSTFTQDKPTAGNTIFAPTPQRPGCNSPTLFTAYSSKFASITPKSPTSIRPGSKIPSLLPSVSHGLVKPDSKSQIRNNSPSPMSERISTTDTKYSTPQFVSNHGKPNNSIRTNLGSNWNSPSPDQHDSSEALSITKIPQPGFYSSSPLSHQSSKRGSISSQSSSSSRPGSIAPPLNTSLDSSTSSVTKEAGYNQLNKPRFSSTDHNLNISTRIPTATLSPSHLSSISSFSSLDSNSPHMNSRATPSIDHTPLTSRIPMLTSTPTSPTSARLGSLPQKVFSSPPSESSSRSGETPVRQTKTWMFGPHKNATVFPVVIKKSPGLGFSITGGLGSTTPTDKREHEGIYVTKVHPNGPASSCLQPGDKILEVDGIDFTKIEHDQAVGILKQTGNIVNMMISRHQ